MESIVHAKQDERFHQLETWLVNQCKLTHFSISPMQGDASFRRYFRVKVANNSFVAMDAPPPQENCRPFVKIANGLRKLGLQAPAIFQADVEQGFLLLADLGDATYLKTLNPQNADELYSRALQALITMQTCSSIEGYSLPSFNGVWMQNEWAWHKEWFLQKLLGLSLDESEIKLDQCFNLIVESAEQQPQVFMHRDYHSANLMVLPDNVGILDFQDAFIGPITYDLVSLLRDCYIEWPDEKVEQWMQSYLVLLQSNGMLQHVNQAAFLRWFDWMGLQRHIKALFTFSRKHLRDGQSSYLRHIPRTFHYILNVSQRYPELSTLHDYMYSNVKPRLEQVLCAR